MENDFDQMINPARAAGSSSSNEIFNGDFNQWRA